MEEYRIVESIKQRILNEYRKHGSLDWAEIAARKIYRTHLVKTCNKPAVSNCTCGVEVTTGWTEVKCCNICGKPIEGEVW